MASPLPENVDFKVARGAAVLRHSVTKSIRNAILLGRFRPGERLPERELCELTGVSRTLVREALRQLESERLIKVIAHRGPVVETLTVADAEGIYRVREELEGLASQLFAERAGPAQFQSLRQALDAVARTIGGADQLARLDAKNHFYHCLLEGAGNEALAHTLGLLNSRIMLLRSMSMQAPGRADASMAELRALLQALAERDGRKARRLSARHVRNAARIALGLLEQHAEAGLDLAGQGRDQVG